MHKRWHQDYHWRRGSTKTHVWGDHALALHATKPSDGKYTRRDYVDDVVRSGQGRPVNYVLVLNRASHLSRQANPLLGSDTVLFVERKTRLSRWMRPTHTAVDGITWSTHSTAMHRGL